MASPQLVTAVNKSIGLVLAKTAGLVLAALLLSGCQVAAVQSGRQLIHYAAFMRPALAQTTDLLQRQRTIVEREVREPLLVFDSGWRADVADLAQDLTVLNELALAYVPPAEAAELHASFLQALKLQLAGATALRSFTETYSVSDFSPVLKQVDKAQKILPELLSMLSALKN